MDKFNISEKFDLINEYWSPKIVAEVNDSYVKLAKLKGKFIWHLHEKEDEVFIVYKGKLLIKFRDKDVFLEEGEMITIPKGVEHLPIAEEEAHVMFIEPKSTLNTGDQLNERTVENLEKI